MIKFKPLELKDRNVFLRYLDGYGFNTYEYSFLTLYFWRKMCNVEYSMVEGSLIIKKTAESGGAYFMQPVGYRQDTLKGIVLKLNEYKKKHPGFENLFRDIESPFLEELKMNFGGNLSAREDVNNSDYIYDCAELIALAGNKHHRKKNHYNQFVKNYDYTVKDLAEPGVLKDCLDFARLWYETRGDKSDLLKYELESIEDVLPKAAYLDLKGMAVYVEGQIVGFTAGEKVSSRMAIVHIEKGDAEYAGIYAFINKTFLERYFSDVQFVNRQEDMGIEGLRKAKMAYHPVRLEKKYIVDCARGEV